MGYVLRMSELAYLGETVSTAYDSVLRARRGHYFKVSLVREPSLDGTAEGTRPTEACVSSVDSMFARERQIRRGGSRCYQVCPRRRHMRGFADLRDRKHWHWPWAAGWQVKSRSGWIVCMGKWRGTGRKMAKLGQTHQGGQKCHGRRVG